MGMPESQQTLPPVEPGSGEAAPGTGQLLFTERLVKLLDSLVKMPNKCLNLRKSGVSVPGVNPYGK